MASMTIATPLTSHIRMEGFSPYYVPRSVEVQAGTPVLWENPTATSHTVTHDGCLTMRQCAFSSGAIPPHGTFRLPNLPPGRYDYHCTLHPIMRGVVVVSEMSVPSQT